MKTIKEYLQSGHMTQNNGPFWAVICNKDCDEISSWTGPYDSEEECLKDLEYADINTKKLYVEDDDFFMQIAILPEEEIIKRLKAAHLYDAPLKVSCKSVDEFAEFWLNNFEI